MAESGKSQHVACIPWGAYRGCVGRRGLDAVYTSRAVPDRNWDNRRQRDTAYCRRRASGAVQVIQGAKRGLTLNPNPERCAAGFYFFRTCNTFCTSATTSPASSFTWTRNVGSYFSCVVSLLRISSSCESLSRNSALTFPLPGFRKRMLAALSHTI